MSEQVILLVEDNLDDLALTLRALEKNNIRNRVVVARNGAEALDYLFCQGAYAQVEQSPLPTLVLLDLNLPKVNGLEVLQKIRANQRTRFVPVVILTSSTEARDLANCYEKGANSYIQKPVDFGKFSESVRQMGFYWLLLNQSPPAGGSAT